MVFLRPTVDSIVKKFTKLSDELRREAIRQEEVATEANIRIGELAEAREAAIAECARADRIADKLEELVS